MKREVEVVESSRDRFRGVEFGICASRVWRLNEGRQIFGQENEHPSGQSWIRHCFKQFQGWALTTVDKTEFQLNADHPGREHTDKLFCSCDSDRDTWTWPTILCILKTCLHTRNELCRLRLSNSLSTTDRKTHRLTDVTEHITMLHLWVVKPATDRGTKEWSSVVTNFQWIMNEISLTDKLTNQSKNKRDVLVLKCTKKTSNWQRKLMLTTIQKQAAGKRLKTQEMQWKTSTLAHH